jgi:hypothetical protein
MRKQLVKVALYLGGAFIVALILGIVLQSCTPLQYVYVDPKDSVVKRQRVIYDNLYVPSPLFFNYGWGAPYYNPIIIQRQRPIVIPHRPQYRPSTPQRPLPPRVPRNR